MRRIGRAFLMTILVYGLEVGMSGVSANDTSARVLNRNIASHDPEFFRELFSGRVLVREFTKDMDWNEERKNTANAMLIKPDGTAFLCVKTRSGRFSPPFHRWSVEAHRNRSVVRFLLRTPKVGGRKAFPWTMFYDPETGEVRFESYNEKKKRWRVPMRGWVQDTWPRVFADGCPQIVLPKGMEVNERQTTTSFSRFRRQDPDAPIRMFPGSQHRAPGAIGRGKYGSGPLVTAEEVETFLREQEGMVLRARMGAGMVVSLNGEQELWWLNERGDIKEVALFEAASDGRSYLFHWPSLDEPGDYWIGDPLPLSTTGHRAAPWQLTDKLITDRKPVPLPWMGRVWRGQLFEFRAHKRVSATGPDASVSEGTWRWTRGRLELAMAGDEPRSIAWRDLAKSLGHNPWMWTQSTPNTP